MPGKQRPRIRYSEKNLREFAATLVVVVVPVTATPPWLTDEAAVAQVDQARTA